MNNKLVLALAFTIALVSNAFADRAPNATEREAIEKVLRADGFSRWEEIEWDEDGHWEVDDAIDADGRSWDLRLDRDLNIIERDD